MRAIVAVSMLVGTLVLSAAQAGQVHRGVSQPCLVEVLSSEMWPVGLTFYHTYRATLRVTPPDGPQYETTVVREMPWQAPPPRQGQRQWVPCDAALLQSSFRFF